MDLVSIIIIFYNSERFLEEAIHSVINQIFNNWELLLVDDGSSDNSTAIAKTFVNQYKSKIKYLDHLNHQNKGAAASRNLGIHYAKGQFIAFLDSDDIWLPEKLHEQVNIMHRFPEVDMIYGCIQRWYSWMGNDSDTRKDFTDTRITEKNRPINPPELFFRNYPFGEDLSPAPSEILIKKSLLLKVNGFEESFTKELQLFEDIAFLAKVYLIATSFASDKTWIKYRIHEDSCCSQSVKNKTYLSVRQFYIKWLIHYLDKINVNDMKIRRIVRRNYMKWNAHSLFVKIYPFNSSKINSNFKKMIYSVYDRLYIR